MGAFSDLMLEAKAAGAIEIDFNVNLNGYAGIDLDNIPRWIATANKKNGSGRTGEEALRNLVALLKAKS